MLTKMVSAALLGWMVLLPHSAMSKSLTDAEITQRIIQASIRNYPKTCACPYSITSNGSRCGKRSAYSKPGGYAPLCYPEDVTPQMIREYRP